MRVANTTRLSVHAGRPLASDALGVQPGQRRYCYRVPLTQDGELCCKLMLSGTRATAQQPTEWVAVITPLRPGYQRVQEYRMRMHIAESFRADKSGSVALAQTQPCDAER